MSNENENNIINLMSKIKESENKGSSSSESIKGCDKPIYLFFGNKINENANIYPSVKVFFIIKYLEFLNKNITVSLNMAEEKPLTKNQLKPYLFDTKKINWEASKVCFSYTENEFINTLLDMNNKGVIYDLAEDLQKIKLTGKTISSDTMSECHKFYVESVQRLMKEGMLEYINMDIVFEEKYNKEDIHVSMNTKTFNFNMTGGEFKAEKERAEKEHKRYFKWLERRVKELEKYVKWLNKRLREEKEKNTEKV